MAPNEAWSGIVSRALLVQNEDELIVPYTTEHQEEIVDRLQEKLLDNHVILLSFFIDLLLD